jgi:hypothetical protein
LGLYLCIPHPTYSVHYSSPSPPKNMKKCPLYSGRLFKCHQGGRSLWLVLEICTSSKIVCTGHYFTQVGADALRAAPLMGQNHFAKPNWYGFTFLHLKYTVQCTCGVALRECIQWNIFPGLIVCSVTLIMKVIRVTKPPDISHRSQQNPGHKLIIRIGRYVQVPFFFFKISSEQVLHLDSEGIFQRVHVCQIGHWWAIWSSYAFCAHYLDHGVPIE